MMRTPALLGLLALASLGLLAHARPEPRRLVQPNTAQLPPALRLRDAAELPAMLRALLEAGNPAARRRGRALLAADSPLAGLGDFNLTALLGSDELRQELLAAAMQLAQVVGLPNSSAQGLEAAAERFVATALPPLLDSLQRSEAQLEALTAAVQAQLAALPGEPSPQDVIGVLTSDELAPQLFAFLKAVLTDSVVGALSAGLEQLACDVYALLSAAGSLSSAEARAGCSAAGSEVEGFFSIISGYLADLPTFKKGLQELRSALALLGPGLQLPGLP